MKKILKNTIKIVVPLLLAGAILYFMYRNFDFTAAKEAFLHQMNPWWLFVSLVPITISHILRGWRWLLTLDPLGYHPRRRNSVYSIFIAYASNILVPRVGEVSRCGVLSKFDGVPFSKSLGTLVAERIVDFLLLLTFVVVVLLTQMNVFTSYFRKTGTNTDTILGLFSNTTFYVVLLCALVLLVAIWYLLKRFQVWGRVKRLLSNFIMGLTSLKFMRRKGLFLFYTIAIWVCYFLEFYVTFYCFPFTAALGVVPALVIFAAVSVAIIVPTPNGAGPWHFAVITMMGLFGVSATDAAIFALIVHAFQTLGVIVLGAGSWVALQIENRNRSHPSKKEQV